MVDGVSHPSIRINSSLDRLARDFQQEARARGWVDLGQDDYALVNMIFLMGKLIPRAMFDGYIKLPQSTIQHQGI